MDPNPENGNKPAPIGLTLGVAFSPALVFLIAALLQRSPLGLTPDFLGPLYFWVLGLGLLSSLWAGIRLSPENKLGAFFLGLGIWFVNAVLSMFGCSVVAL